MAQNTNPVFTKTPKVNWANLSNGTGAVAIDGTSNTVTVFTAHASEGSRLDKLIVQATGTNVATVLRVYVNNGASSGTATNNSYIRDVTLPATTTSATIQLGPIEIPFDLPLPAGYKILCGVGTAVGAGTNSGYQITGVGGDYA